MNAAWRVATLGVALVACQDLAGPPPDPEPGLDAAFFRCRVQPVLTQYCSMFLCHGDGARVYTTFARGRLRLGGTERDRLAALTDEERAWNYRAAAAMIDRDDPDESPLLLKPLAVAGGGWFHGATRLEGGYDVFDDRDSREWRTLSDWAHGMTEDPSCVEPGSDL